MRTRRTSALSTRTALRLLAGTASLAATLLSGCAFSGVTSQGTTANTLHLNGSVFGGQQPISGATIQLYTVGTTGTGAASTPLIGATVTTNATGGFNITGTYSCTNATQVYIVATGGNPGAGTNTYSTLAAALGSCAALTSTTFISINELTTVAAAYALAPFEGAAYTSIGAATTTQLGTLGLPNAFLTANTLVSSATGVQPANLPTGLIIPGSTLDTLADILAACVNSTGSGSPACTQLNTATSATNTFDAAFYIAKHPGATAVTGLYSLQGSTAPFQPTLASAPKDFTIAVRFTGSGTGTLSTPSGIAIDADGNALVTNQTGNTVTGMSPLSTTFGAFNNVAANAGGFAGPLGIAIDPNGFEWIANPGAGNVVELASFVNGYGGVITQFPSVNSRPVTLSGSLNSNPNGIVAASSLVFTVSPAENKVYSIDEGAGAVAGILVNAGFNGTGAISFSNAGTLAVGSSAGQVCTTTTSLATPTCTTQGSATGISALGYNTSLNSAGYAGIGNEFASNSPLYGPSLGSASTFSNPFATGNPTAIAFDSAGNAYLTLFGAVFEENGPTYIGPVAAFPTGPVGYGTLSAPRGVAVDPSGNIWTTNSGDNSVSIFVGLAAPTLTPIAVNLH